MGKTALISGISGQDGSYLAELLLEKGYEVIGLVRGGNGNRDEPLSGDDVPLRCACHLRDSLTLRHGDLLAPESLSEAVAATQPDELYHLAAPSFVPDSWQRPSESFAAIAGATATLLEAVRDRSPHTRAFFANSAAMFGEAGESPQREQTLCVPQNPYAIAKLAAHQLVGALRDRAGIFACSGILYNHESERRPEQFVTRRITRAAAKIKRGLSDHVTLGDLDATRDWCFAGDVMAGAAMLLQQDKPFDCIFASGIPHTVADVATIAFAHVGLEASAHIRLDPALQRGREPVALVGDISRARERLGWQPTLSFKQLIERMVDSDLEALEQP